MSQTENSMLVPQYLLPLGLRGRVKVGVRIGQFLFDEKPIPEAAPAPVECENHEKPAKKGRPRKGEVRQQQTPRGAFGTRQCRSAEQEVHLMQTRLGDSCLPRAPFGRLVKDLLDEEVNKRGIGF